MYWQDAKSALEAVKYKPNWHWRVEPLSLPWQYSPEAASGGMAVTVTMEVPDSRPQWMPVLSHPYLIDAWEVRSSPAKPIEVSGRFTVPGHILSHWTDARQVQAWLLGCIVGMETHEAREFFLVDDERVFDPHSTMGRDAYRAEGASIDLGRTQLT